MKQTMTDRVSEVYEGLYAGGAFQKRTRKRVDWICAQVSGAHILDIGCSQGIVDLLLARSGKRVLAIDIDPESISYAQQKAAQEPLEVQQHLHYVCVDFLEQDLEDEQFDYILLTEVLEHLEDPDACLEKMSALLQPEGQVLVMVPFGINPHPDHKRTYYYLDLLHSMQRYFQPAAVDFLEGWVAIRAYSREGAQKSGIPFDEQLVEQMEKGFCDVDMRKQESIDALRSSLNQSNEQAQMLSEKYEAEHQQSQELLSQLNEERERFRQENDRLKLEHEQLQQLMEEVQAERTQEQQELASLVAQYQTLSQEKNAVQQRVSEYKKSLLRWQKKYDTLSKSKLGHLQISWWNHQGNRRRAKQARRRKWKNRLRTLVFNHPLLTKLYIKIRRPQQAAVSKPGKKTGDVPFQIPDWAYVPQKEFEAQTDRDFFERVKPLIDSLPQSNGCRYYLRGNVRIGIVADQFLLDSIRDAADFVFLTPDQWQEQIADLDLLLMVSAWSGLHEEWRGAAVANSAQQQRIFEIIAACKERKIPTIFYSKEDPPNYDRFLPIARHCDIIFTSCAEVMDNYRRDCGNDRVYVLPFGVNPLFHNPVGMRNPHKQSGVIFSGSWMNKYPDRCDDMNLLLGGVLKAGVPLKIVDRNYRLAATNYRFPPEYWPGISPAIAHDDLQKIHKLYDWALDINTVKTSMTMFANRGYELQACGNLQISNYSAGVNDKLPFVFIANEQQEVVEILKNMTPEDVYRRQVEGVRAMMTGETCFDRVETLAASAGITLGQPVRRCAVIADADTPRVREMFERQTYPEKALFFSGGVTAGELAAFDLIAFFSDEMDYEIFYLEDMINGFKYTACDYITKAAYFSGDQLHAGTEHDFVSQMGSKYRTVFWREAFSPEELLTMDGGVHQLPNGYSIDHFNYNAQPYREKPLPEGLELSVIVPVYNNGRFLMAKCFASLQRSTIFSKMHIFLVDDGSTDGETPNIVRYLERTYPNVTMYFFGDGGSGSASRPRNKGVELADTEYITFLDPDNEAVNDGYAAMYAMLGEAPAGQPYDVVVGDLIKCSQRPTYGRYHKNLGCPERGCDVYTGDMRQLLMDSNFLAMSVQAMLIRREMLVENHLEQVPGAVGEDTLFSWEVVAHAHSIRATPLPIHIYYAMVGTSTTNTVGKKFFLKSQLIEAPRREFLQRHRLLQFYAEHRYNRYFTGWILKALCRAKPEEEEACARIVYEMHLMYQDCYDGKSRVINDFAKHCQAGQYGQALSAVRQANQEGRL